MNNNGIDMQDDEIDLLELLHHFVRKWWLFLIGGAVGGVVFFLVTSFLITPLYESSATIYILSKTTSITAALDMTTGEELAEDFQIIATSNPVLDGAAEQIKKDTGKEITREQMKKIVTVSDDATRLLVITATSDNPETSALVAMYGCQCGCTTDQRENGGDYKNRCSDNRRTRRSCGKTGYSECLERYRNRRDCRRGCYRFDSAR